jgi:hypothetical protein
MQRTLVCSEPGAFPFKGRRLLQCNFVGRRDSTYAVAGNVAHHIGTMGMLGANQKKKERKSVDDERMDHLVPRQETEAWRRRNLHDRRRP